VSRTLSTALATHISGRSHTRCNMLLLDLSDGTSIGITDHDKDLTYDIGDGSVTYSSGTGILTSDVSLSCGLDADNYEVRGPIADVVTLDGVLGGRFNRARARLFQVNWKDLTQGAIKLLAGNISEARVEGGEFVFEVRSDVDRYNQVVGRTIANNCDADYGDARCGTTPESETETVTAATSAMVFAVTNGGARAADFFNLGTIEFTSGELTGQVVEIFDWGGAGQVELFAPLTGTPAIGDACTLRRGCGKSRADCMARNNILNFRGYPEVPGRKALMPAIPGA
jgi:uncharacterized phage protein (TIGR02218 family)